MNKWEVVNANQQMDLKTMLWLLLKQQRIDKELFKWWWNKWLRKTIRDNISFSNGYINEFALRNIGSEIYQRTRIIRSFLDADGYNESKSAELHYWNMGFNCYRKLPHGPTWTFGYIEKEFSI